MSMRVLVLGGSGTLGKPVALSLAERGHRVRVLARDREKAQRILGSEVHVLEGDSKVRDHVRRAMDGCDAVHVSLPADSELIALQHVVELAPAGTLDRITYVSGTSVCEENRWFEVVDVKMCAEELLRRSGIPHTVFCPTWVMEVLHNFVQGRRAAVISSRRPTGIHFFAASDFGRMVAASYEDDRALGRRLFIYGPDAITLPHALRTFLEVCHPQSLVVELRLWEARLLARLTKRMDAVSRLIRFFDRVGELGSPAEANALLGSPSTTLGEWIEKQATPQRFDCRVRPLGPGRPSRHPRPRRPGRVHENA